MTPSRFEGAAAEQIVAALGMTPIDEEGAYFAMGPRSTGLSSITALVTDTPDGFSALHRLTVDEGWQWLEGAPLVLVRLHPDGGVDHVVLGPMTPQALVPAGTWQGASTRGDWSLIACWCAPAFTPDVFELGRRDDLLAAYPDSRATIERLTRD
jgi:predicted cupin superfamily sugar epimerase